MSDFNWSYSESETMSEIIKSDSFDFTPLKSIPLSCRNCSNHPSNGGSGVCFCILGLPEIKC